MLLLIKAVTLNFTLQSWAEKSQQSALRGADVCVQALPETVQKSQRAQATRAYPFGRYLSLPGVCENVPVQSKPYGSYAKAQNQR